MIMRQNLMTTQVKVHVWDHPETKYFSVQTLSSYAGFLAVEREGQFPLICRVNNYDEDATRIGAGANESFVFNLLDVNAIDVVIGAMPDQFGSDELEKLFEGSQVEISTQAQNDRLKSFNASAQEVLGEQARQRAIGSRYRNYLQASDTELVQYINLNNLILFVLYQGGLQQYEETVQSDAAFSLNYIILPLPGFCLPIHRMHIRWTAIMLFLLCTILTVNYFLKIKDVNGYSLFLSPFLCCIVSCIACCKANLTRNNEKLGRYSTLDSFRQIKQLLRMAQDKMDREVESIADVMDIFPNEVRVRIWRGKGGDVGHASLQTAGIYASFWPTSRDKSALLSVGGKLNTLPEDLIAEQRSPDVVFSYQALNVEAMHRIFEQFQQQDQNWSLLGSSLLREEDKNCCGLVLGLLRSGGLDLQARADGWMLDIFACMLSCIWMAIVGGVLYFPFQARILQDRSEPITAEDNGVGVVISIVFILCVIIPLVASIMICRRNFKGQGLVYTPNGLEKLLEKAKSKKESVDANAPRISETADIRLHVNDRGDHYDYGDDNDYDDDWDAGAGAGAGAEVRVPLLG